MAENDERKRFEEWFLTEFAGGVGPRDYVSGEYKSSVAHYGWRTWQARAALDAEAEETATLQANLNLAGDLLTERRAEMGRMADDAERYRWLRSGKATMQEVRSILNDTPLGIDAAVDAARNKAMTHHE